MTPILYHPIEPIMRISMFFSIIPICPLLCMVSLEVATRGRKKRIPRRRPDLILIPLSSEIRFDSNIGIVMEWKKNMENTI